MPQWGRRSRLASRGPVRSGRILDRQRPAGPVFFPTRAAKPVPAEGGAWEERGGWDGQASRPARSGCRPGHRRADRQRGSGRASLEISPPRRRPGGVPTRRWVQRSTEPGTSGCDWVDLPLEPGAAGHRPPLDPSRAPTGIDDDLIALKTGRLWKGVRRPSKVGALAALREYDRPLARSFIVVKVSTFRKPSWRRANSARDPMGSARLVAQRVGAVMAAGVRPCQWRAPLGVRAPGRR